MDSETAQNETDRDAIAVHNNLLPHVKSSVRLHDVSELLKLFKREVRQRARYNTHKDPYNGDVVVDPADFADCVFSTQPPAGQDVTDSYRMELALQELWTYVGFVSHRARHAAAVRENTAQVGAHFRAAGNHALLGHGFIPDHGAGDEVDLDSYTMSGPSSARVRKMLREATQN